MRAICICAVALVLAFSATAHAALSGNLIVGGDFEVPSAIKTIDSPRTQDEIDVGADPVRAWQFHPGGIAAEATAEYNIGDYFTDYGRWIGGWGISTQDDRNNATAPNNVSTVGGNSYMEGVRFRSWVTQVVKAPANHVAGPATIDFDYYFNQWTPSRQVMTNAANSIFHVWIGGINDEEIPTWADRAGPIFGGNLYGEPGATQPNKWGTLNPLWDSPNWDSQPWGWTGVGSGKTALGSQGTVWHSFSTDFPNEVTFNISQTYDNYYVSVWQCLYSEPHDYFWLYGGAIADQMAVAIDNIDFRVSVASAVLRGDVNLDGLVNALDISPFVARLTQGQYQAEADINQDSLVNALDISGFVQCLVNGACPGVAGGSAVPEPAGLALLSVGLLALMRRR